MTALQVEHSEQTEGQTFDFYTVLPIVGEINVECANILFSKYISNEETSTRLWYELKKSTHIKNNQNIKAHK